MFYDFEKEQASEELSLTEEQKIDKILLTVCAALKERDYRPVDQLTGYLMSRDPAYITTYKGARELISGVEPEEIIEYLLKEYVKNKEI